jgi:hypothetical protein
MMTQEERNEMLRRWSQAKSALPIKLWERVNKYVLETDSDGMTVDIMIAPLRARSYKYFVVEWLEGKSPMCWGFDSVDTLIKFVTTETGHMKDADVIYKPERIDGFVNCGLYIKWQSEWLKY